MTVAQRWARNEAHTARFGASDRTQRRSYYKNPQSGWGIPAPPSDFLSCLRPQVDATRRWRSERSADTPGRVPTVTSGEWVGFVEAAEVLGVGVYRVQALILGNQVAPVHNAGMGRGIDGITR
jgi:hypothetical protein